MCERMYCACEVAMFNEVVLQKLSNRSNVKSMVLLLNVADETYSSRVFSSYRSTLTR